MEIIRSIWWLFYGCTTYCGSRHAEGNRQPWIGATRRRRWSCFKLVSHIYILRGIVGREGGIKSSRKYDNCRVCMAGICEWVLANPVVEVASSLLRSVDEQWKELSWPSISDWHSARTPRLQLTYKVVVELRCNIRLWTHTPPPPPAVPR